MPTDGKILSIQYLRGMAALGVVLCHYGSNLLVYPRLSKFFNFGQSGVHVFFLISGFIIVYSLNKSNYTSRQFFTFLLKRSIRIDPPYYAVIVLTIALFEILSFLPSFNGYHISFIPGQFIAHILYVVPFTKYSFYNHVFWTLCVEFQFYLLIGVIYFLWDNYIYKTSFLILFGLTILIPLPNSYNLVFTYAPIFALGVSLVSLYQRRNLPAIILPLLMLSLIFYKFGALIFILLAVSAGVVISLKLVIKPLFLLGQISYSLYLTHGLVFIVFFGIIKRFHVNPAENELCWLALEIFVATASAYLFYVLIEKPSLKLSKHFFYSKR